MNALYGPRFHPARPAPADGFAKGFVVGGCLSAFQDVAAPASGHELRRILRHALQSGTALAAGERAAAALRQRDYSGALAATFAGAAGVLLIERLLRDGTRHLPEKDHGQEA